MTILTRGIPTEFDFALDGKGYIIADETDHAGSLGTTYIRGSYIKIGNDLQVPRQDFSHDISENKLDGLFRSGQRSWFNGAGQKRLDNPQSSDNEQFLRGKNIDPFHERGQLTLSHAISSQFSGVASGGQAEGFVTASESYMYWATPDSGTPSNTNLKSINLWADTPTVKSFDANWTAGTKVQGLTNDGLYVYASNTTKGVFRSLLSNQSATMNQWNAQGLRDIAFVKERILGHTTSAGAAQVWSIDTITGTAQQVGVDYPPGFSFRTATGHQSIFAEVGGVACWVISAGSDGYLYTWDGTAAPIRAARFPSFQAWGIISFAEQFVYVIGRDPSGSPMGDRWCIIRCDISASGQATYDVLHIVDDLPLPRAVVQDTEVLFPVRFGADDYAGMTTDNGISGGNAYAVASLNVATNGLILGKHWGLTNVSVTPHTTTAILWGGTKFLEPDICVFRNTLVLAGENGEIRAEQTSYPPYGQAVSSAVDFNIDSDKTFLLGEIGSDPVPTGSNVVLETTTQDPDTETPTWEQSCEIDAGGRSARGHLTPKGTKAPFMHYRVTLNSATTNTPFLRKAALAATYAQKPVYEHRIVVKAYENMSLRNNASWPRERGPDKIQTELESLRDSQEVVEFQEPISGRGSRQPRKVQVRELNIRKMLMPEVGWQNLIDLRVVEVPDESTS